MLKYATLLFVGVAYSNAASAANWIDVSISTTGAVWSIDSNSVKDVVESYRDTARKVWVKVDYSKVASEPAREAKLLTFFKCNEEQYKTTTWVEYKPDGTVLRDISSAYSAYKPVIPETVVSAVMSEVCSINQKSS